MNRVSQVVGVAIGMLGLYAIWLVLPMLPSLVTNPSLFVWVLVALWFLVGATLLHAAYGAIFRQSDRDLKNLSVYAALVVWTFTDNAIEPVLNQWRAIEDERQRDLFTSGLAIVLAIATYQVLKRTTHKNMSPNQAL